MTQGGSVRFKQAAVHGSTRAACMNERDLIYDWNALEPEVVRDESAHPHPIWFDDETLRDGLQSPSARNPSIGQKIELLDHMEALGIQKVDLGLPGAGPQHREHIDALLSHIVDEGLSIRPGCAVRTLRSDIEPIAELQSKHGIDIQASAFLEPLPSDSTRRIGRVRSSSRRWRTQSHSQSMRASPSCS